MSYSQDQSVQEAFGFIDRFEASPSLSQEEIAIAEKKLQALKALGRDAAVSSLVTPAIADQLVTKFVETNYSETVVIESLTILANALVNNNSLLTSWDSRAALPTVLALYDQGRLSPMEKHLYGRVLFLLTFNGLELPSKVVQDCASAVDAKMANFLDQALVLTTATTSPLRNAFIELVKFMFNLAHHYPDSAIEPFTQHNTVAKLGQIFLYANPTVPENIDFVRYIFNSFLCFPVSTWSDNADDEVRLVTKVFEYCQYLTGSALAQHHNEQTLSPAVTCVEKVVSHVWTLSSENAHAKDLKSICGAFLYPSENDRKNGLGNSESLPSNLLKLGNDPTLKTTNRLVNEIYLTAFGQDQQRLAQVMGLGFAARFLSGGAGKVTELPSDQTDLAAVNPVTGQSLEAEALDQKRADAQQEWDAMTEEEKEREAERMFVLFDRLNKNGIITVTNPFEQAKSK